MKKRSEFFGQDPINVPAVLAKMIELAQEQPDLRWAALIDAAFDYPSPNQAPYSSHGINCYGSAEYEGLEKAAPILLPIDPVNDQAFLSQLLRHCHDRPMISFLASRVELEELCKSWCPLHWITAVDHQRMILRLADTRTLAALPQVLTPAQWAAISGQLATWVIVDRTGAPASLPLPGSDLLKVSAIHLEHNQLSTLLEVAEPDNILSLLSESMSDVLPKDMPGSARHIMVSKSCELARRFEISNWSDVVSLSVAAFLTKGFTTRDEQLADYLSQKQWTPGDLGSSLVSEELI